MDKKYILDTEENRQWMKQLSDELLDFGKRFPSPEGGSYYLGDDGTPWTDRPRETWITCRMAHVYSMGAMMDYPGARELAEKALKGLQGELKDKENGGWYAGIRPDGSYLPDKQCYAHAFVILAGTSLKLAGIDGAEELLQDAIDTYFKYFWSDKDGMACDTWDTAFTELSPYRGVNANMHTVEAFLAAYDALDDRSFLLRAGNIINRVLGLAAGNLWRIPEHYTEDWKPDLNAQSEKKDDPFKPYGATPGHGIEWARLITQWAYATYKDKETAVSRDFYVASSVDLYNRAVADAWNADGAPGLVYTTDWDGTPIVHDRMHWTLAEAINTSAVLYHVTGEEKFKKDYAMFMEYLDTCVLDKVNGSWFHELDQNNHVKGDVWPGKSDLYHAFQSTLIPYNKNISTSIAKSVLEGTL